MFTQVIASSAEVDVDRCCSSTTRDAVDLFDDCTVSTRCVDVLAVLRSDQNHRCSGRKQSQYSYTVVKDAVYKKGLFVTRSCCHWYLPHLDRLPERMFIPPEEGTSAFGVALETDGASALLRGRYRASWGRLSFHAEGTHRAKQRVLGACASPTQAHAFHGVCITMSQAAVDSHREQYGSCPYANHSVLGITRGLHRKHRVSSQLSGCLQDRCLRRGTGLRH